MAITDGQQRINFEADFDEAQRLFIVAARRAIAAGGANSTSFHVFGLVRLVFNFSTRRGFREPSPTQPLSMEWLCEEFFLKETAMRGVIERALATRLISRTPDDPSGVRCPYRYNVDIEAANEWLAGGASKRRSSTTRTAVAAEVCATTSAPSAGEYSRNEVRPAPREVRPASGAGRSAPREVPIRNNFLSVLSDERSAPFERTCGAANFEEGELAEVGRKFAEFGRVVPTRTDGDRRLVLLAAVWWVRQVLPPDAIAQSIEAVDRKGPKNRAAFFRSCLVNQAKARGGDFHKLEAATPLPDLAAQPPMEKPAAVAAVERRLATAVRVETPLEDELQRLEASVGAEFDALSREQQFAVAEACSGFVASHFCKEGPAASAIRLNLLRQFLMQKV